MTHALLSASKQAAAPDPAVPAKDRNIFDFFYGVLLLRVLSFVWVWWAVQHYQLLLQRPASLFWQPQWFLRQLMPELPSPSVFYLVSGMAVLANGYMLLRTHTLPLLQALLCACLLWLNLPQWGYGYLSHVNHTFLLAHLFLVAIPIGRTSLREPVPYLGKSINWFYAGILFTYTLAGSWKLAALLYKLITGSNNVNWLHPDAAFYTAFVSHRSYDLPFLFARWFTSFPLLWQVGFLGMIYLQVISIFAAFRHSLRPWIGLLLVLFHLLNLVVFNTSFVMAMLVLACLFTPYNFIFAKQKDFLTDATPAVTPFERFRQRLLQRHYLLAGLLYFPGIGASARLLSRSRPRR